MTKKSDKRGPDPERLKIDADDWKDALAEALKKKRPKGGWPDKNDERSPEGDDPGAESK